MSDRQLTAATTHPVTLAEAKSQLNVSSTLDDTLIGDLVAAATQRAEEFTNRRFVNETRTLKMNGFYDCRYSRNVDRVFVPKTPLSSVSSITYVDTNGTTQTLSSTVYSVSTADIPGRIEPSYNNVWPSVREQPDSVTVTYVAGYSSTQSSQPAVARQAILMDVGHLYRNRESVDDMRFRETPLGWKQLLSPLIVEDYG